MVNNMKKTSLSLLIMALFVFSTAMSIGIENNVAPEDISLGDTRSTHTVLVEVGTTQWCGPCSGWNDNIFSFYESGTYDFEYVEMICQNHGGSILIQ